MINKQVKIVGGGVNRSTPIDLKTIDVEVAALAERSPRTPIGMKELWDEVQNLKNANISCKVVTFNIDKNAYPKVFKYNAPSNCFGVMVNGNVCTSQKSGAHASDNIVTRGTNANLSLISGSSLIVNVKFDTSGLITIEAKQDGNFGTYVSNGKLFIFTK